MRKKKDKKSKNPHDKKTKCYTMQDTEMHMLKKFN